MRTRAGRRPEVDVNYYIAFTDMAFTLVLVMVLVVVVVTVFGRVGWDDIKYKEAQRTVAEAVETAYASRLDAAPDQNHAKNDPAGAQRWVFDQSNLFEGGTARLTPQGRADLLRFAEVVREHQVLWRRLRIEGHTRPPRHPDERDDWGLSAGRAEEVARVFSGAGHIPAFRMAIAGRAGQNPRYPGQPDNPANERVEILVEYSLRAP